MSAVRTRSAWAAGLVTLVPLLLAAQTPDSSMAGTKMGSLEHMAKKLTTGSFKGAEGHQSAGSYEISSRDGKLALTTSRDFTVDTRAPDVYVVLSDGAMVGTGQRVWLGKIKSHTGAQAFAIPAGVKLEGLTTIVLWCKKYSATIGTADFDPVPLVQAAMKNAAMKPPAGSRDR